MAAAGTTWVNGRDRTRVLVPSENGAQLAIAWRESLIVSTCRAKGSHPPLREQIALTLHSHPSDGLPDHQVFLSLLYWRPTRVPALPLSHAETEQFASVPTRCTYLPGILRQVRFFSLAWRESWRL